MLPVNRSITSLRPFLPISTKQLFCHPDRKMGSTVNAKEEVQLFNRFLNEESRLRKPSVTREMTKLLYASGPGTIFCAGGIPNPSLFPFSSLTVQLDDGSGTTLNVSGDELRNALQYQPTLGYTAFHDELKKFVQHWYAPPRDWTENDIIVTVGSQNALADVLLMVFNPEEPVILPEPCYTALLQILEPHKPTYLTVPEDNQGIQPAILRSKLEAWYKSANATPGKDLFHDNNFKRPKMLYVNPTGGNPSGIVIPSERKKEIYRIAQEYDLLILEDDPYYFLHFLQEDPTTFLSLDVDGRVIRLDSFSKILSSGLRIGFATGPKDLIRMIELRLQANILHASSLSQVLAHGVLQRWGNDGFLKHTKKVKALYKGRRDMMIAAAEKHLTGLAEWYPPEGGMFLWVKVLGVEDTTKMLMEHGLKRKFMALPGRAFMPDKSKPCPYVRLSFSVIPEEQMKEVKINSDIVIACLAFKKLHK